MSGSMALLLPCFVLMSVASVINESSEDRAAQNFGPAPRRVQHQGEQALPLTG